jgi:hypothetical protein
LFQVSKDSYLTQIPDLASFAENFLSVSHIVSAIMVQRPFITYIKYNYVKE